MNDKIKVFALGGLDERGKNIYVVEKNDDIFVIDGGMKYPEKTMPGIDFIIPNIDYLMENRDRIVGIIASHAHNDMIGSLPYIIKQLKVPVYTSKVTAYFIKDAARLHQVDTGEIDFRYIEGNEEKDINGNKVYFFNTTHSVAESFGVAIDSDQGLVVYTGDYIFDFAAANKFSFDISFMSQLASKGVLLMLGESDGADHLGHTSPKHRLTPLIEPYFVENESRIFISQFTQSLFGINEIIELALKYNRKILFYSREMQRHVEVFRKFGIFNIPDNMIVSHDYLANENNKDVCVIFTGIGERIYRVLKKVADGEKNKNMFVQPDDFIIIATATVPGCEVEAASASDAIFRTGAKVVTISRKQVASMHASREDIMMMLKIFRPKYYMPVKGEFRQLLSNAQLAVDLNMGYNHQNVIVYDNGMVAQFENGKKIEKFPVPTVPVGDVYVDGLGVGDIGSGVLEDRQRLSDNGVVILGATVNQKTGIMVAGPDIQIRGLVYLRDAEDLVKDITKTFVEILTLEIKDPYYILEDVEKKIRDRISFKIRKSTGKDPLIIPAIVELK